MFQVAIFNSADAAIKGSNKAATTILLNMGNLSGILRVHAFEAGSPRSSSPSVRGATGSLLNPLEIT
jgi:hypothetical protein